MVLWLIIVFPGVATLEHTEMYAASYSLFLSTNIVCGSTILPDSFKCLTYLYSDWNSLPKSSNCASKFSRSFSLSMHCTDCSLSCFFTTSAYPVRASVTTVCIPLVICSCTTAGSICLSRTHRTNFAKWAFTCDHLQFHTHHHSQQSWNHVYHHHLHCHPSYHCWLWKCLCWSVPCYHYSHMFHGAYWHAAQNCQPFWRLICSFQNDTTQKNLHRVHA